MTRFIGVISLVVGLNVAAASEVFAGAGGYPGVIQHNSTASALKASFKLRHNNGIDYALDDNSEFIKLIENVALKAVANSACSTCQYSKEIADVIVAVKREVSRINYVNKNGLDAVFYAKAAAAIAEPLVNGYLENQVPGSSKLLTGAKLSLAFAIAYSYGFLNG